jgi:hypothetical protein
MGFVVSVCSYVLEGPLIHRMVSTTLFSIDLYVLCAGLEKLSLVVTKLLSSFMQDFVMLHKRRLQACNHRLGVHARSGSIFFFFGMGVFKGRS